MTGWLFRGQAGKRYKGEAKPSINGRGRASFGRKLKKKLDNKNWTWFCSILHYILWRSIELYLNENPLKTKFKCGFQVAISSSIVRRMQRSSSRMPFVPAEAFHTGMTNPTPLSGVPWPSIRRWPGRKLQGSGLLCSLPQSLRLTLKMRIRWSVYVSVTV